MELGKLLRELVKSGPGRVGLGLFCLMVLASVYVLLTYPPNYGAARWGNPSLWADNPKAKPPVWSAWFSSRAPARHQVLAATEPAERRSDARSHTAAFVFEFTHAGDIPPSFLSLSIGGVTYYSRPPVITATLVRPDGREVVLYRATVQAPRPGEQAPYARHAEVPLRVALDADERAIRAAAELAGALKGAAVSERDVRGSVLAVLFGTAAAGTVPVTPGGATAAAGAPSAGTPGSGSSGNAAGATSGAGEFAPLKGVYRLKVEVMAVDPRDSVAQVRAVVGGTVYGLMGTDALGRDLAEGLLFGLPVALLIGIAAATASTVLGTALGLISGYLGGWWDNVIQRAADIVTNVPVLPLLIFLVFIGGTQLWLILLVLVAFSWPGLAITVRSMALQHRSGQEVEAARALGASGARIIFRHVFPHTAAFIFAQLVFSAPSAILAEAGLSFLGLGDPSIPTWGQILEHGFRTGAVYLGYWWWVVPPGTLIVLTAVTFMLLALGLEPAVDPRLRRSRPWRS